MQQSPAKQDTIVHSPQPSSSVDHDYGAQGPPQPFTSQDDRAQAPPTEHPGGGQAPPTNSDHEPAAEQAAPAATPRGDGPRLPDTAVVIPQRRPGDRARGFARAYAPDLLRCGVDRAAFLGFIDGLNRAVASGPAVQAVDLAGEAVGAVPGSELVGAPVLGVALQVAAGAYKEVSARRGQNSYLNKMNDELFRPRGLYCLIMSYDVKSRSNVVRHGQSDSPGHVIRQGMSQGSRHSRMRSNDGMLGASNFPTTSRLVYPDPIDPPENSPEGDGSEEGASSGTWGSGRARIRNLLAAHAEKEDLKSQAKFQKNNPTSLLNALLDPKAELSEKDRQKQEKREAEQQKKEEKRDREAEKRALKYPDKAPKVHKPKEVVVPADPHVSGPLYSESLPNC